MFIILRVFETHVFLFCITVCSLSNFYLLISPDSSFFKLLCLSIDARGGHTKQNKLKYGSIPFSNE